jgi:hypothetical protein
VPNVARIYDYLLGGKDNFAADREAAEELRHARSGGRALSRSRQIPDAGVADAEIVLWSRDAAVRLRIAARLAREVTDGKYKDWRPSGSDLADEYDVSPSTANRARHLLADRGLIRREGNSWFAAPGAASG